jgi:uncharacterized protein (DUF2141 family)
MKILAHLVIGLGLVGTSHAQTNAARVELNPIPTTLPAILFDPAPLSGTMLKPLAGSGPDALRPAVEPAPAALTAEPAAAEVAPELEPAVAAVPVAADPAEALTPSEPPAVEEEAIVEPEPEPAPPKKPEKPATTTVNVIVEGVESSKGVINVALCDKGLSREGCPFTKATPAAAGFVEARFEDIPPGVYAVVGYHDVNNNDEFDKMLGVPREPYALSNKAGEMLVPGFKDAALNIKQGDNTVIIRMQRLGS